MATVREKRVALVVGASRGIGRQIAIDLAKNDYSGTLCAPISASHLVTDEEL